MMTRVACGLLAAVAAFGQNSAAVTAFTGEEVAQRTVTLADGSLSTETTAAGRVYRDSHGRVRTERTTSPDTMTVQIVDPAAGTRYGWDTRTKVVYRSELVRIPVKAAQAEMVADAPAAMMLGIQQMTVEPLGKRMMDGIEASGQRIMNTILPGAESNQRLTTIVTEMWVSRQLGVTLASTVVDPRVGETTYRLRNISLWEPDAGLFVVPAEYRIVEEGASSGLPLN